MQFENIIKELSGDESKKLHFASNEIMVKRRLKSIVAGVPIYQLEVHFLHENFEPEIFDTFEELDDFSLRGDDKNIRRCKYCGCLPESYEGYYVYPNLNIHFCCHSHLVKYMDETYGQGNWRYEESEGNKVYIKVDKSVVDFYKNMDIHKIDGEYWREEECKYVSPYIEEAEWDNMDDEIIIDDVL